MARSASLSLVLPALAVCVLAATAPAQPAANPAAAPAKPADAASASAAPTRNRAISSGVAQQLAASVPKFTPPPPKPPPKPADEEPDLRDIDKPKNTIIRLPKYIVQEQKPAVLSERAVNTSKGLADIAVRRYISEVDRAMNRFTLPLFGTSTEARALAMYAEQERLDNMSDMTDAARTVSRSDPEQGTYILRESQKTYMRTSDFGWNGGGPK